MYKKICKLCGKEFNSKRKNNNYCDTCRNTKVKCCGCQKHFIPRTEQLNRITKGINVYCSVTCFNKSSTKRKKMSETWKKKSKEEIKNISNKRKCTYKEKTGYDNPSQNPGIKEKKKEAYIEHYGYEHNFAVPEIIKQKKETWLEKYGVDSPMKVPEVRQKASNTYKEKTGYTNPLQNPKIKKKVKDKQFIINDGHYAFDTPVVHLKAGKASQTPEIQKKRKQTYKKKTGYDHPSQNPEVKEKKKEGYKEKTGYEYPTQNPAVWKKVNETRRKNNNRSQDEILFEEKLNELNLIKNKDYFVEYYDKERYPFYCDFYLAKEDLFIELNIHFVHGHHWFDKNSNDDQKTLKLWQEKAKSSEHYQNAVNAWTERDPLKRGTARKNNLNYVMLWSQQDILDWFALGMPSGKDWDREYSWKK